LSGRPTPYLLLALLSIVAMRPAMAGHGPDSAVVTITAAYARELLSQGQKLLFVDLRPRAEFEKGHVPTARSVPRDEVAGRFQQAIPKNDFVILYCACPLKAVESIYLFLRAQGYRTIVVMEDGFGAWVSQGYPVER
jgi:cytochrome c oxidase cbb3-type subunit III